MRRPYVQNNNDTEHTSGNVSTTFCTSWTSLSTNAVSRQPTSKRPTVTQAKAVTSVLKKQKGTLKIDAGQYFRRFILR